MDRNCSTVEPPPEVHARSESLSQEGHSHYGFSRFATQIAALTGRPVTFALALGTILVWAISGPIFRFSDTWQLVINTGTTIVTFLMVFVIQNAQNRDAMAIQVKLDELICATKDARDKLVGIEDMDDVVVESLKTELKERTAQAQDAADAG
jgi:low affinity Fe/Cu permease